MRLGTQLRSKIDASSSEQSLRRAAKRRGLRLEKLRYRNPRDTGYRGFRLIENDTNTVILGWGDMGVTLQSVGEYLRVD